MRTKRPYRAVCVERVDVDSLDESIGSEPVTIGLDVAKHEIIAVVRDSTGAFSSPWKVKQPSQIGELVQKINRLAANRPVVVALESTGTYSDPVRQALSDCGLVVNWVSGRDKSDYQEIFDGVPSAHDAKDAAIIAELAAFGKSRRWLYQEPGLYESEMASRVDWLDLQQCLLRQWQGRLEALASRHWPEVTRMIGLRTPTLLRLLAHYGGPEEVAKDVGAAARLAAWGGKFLKGKKIEAICSSARTTVGVRLGKHGHAAIRRYAAEALRARDEVRSEMRGLKKLAKQQEVLRRVASVVGVTTACVLHVSVGDPSKYHSGAAYRKALGLNLMERSSGRFKGQLKISKRGRSIARRWLYFAAMRQVQKPPVRDWFEDKKARDGGRGRGAIIAVMRKLSLAIHVVATRGEPFEPSRLVCASRHIRRRLR